MSALATLAPGTGSVRIRSTLGQWLWLLVSVTAAIVLTQALLALFFWGTPPEQMFVSVATFVAVWALATAPIQHWQGVTLTPTALRVHNLQSRVIPWPDIASLSTPPLRRRATPRSPSRRTRRRRPSPPNHSPRGNPP